MECKYGFYTCSNLDKRFHSPEFCDTCDEGQNYQDINDFKTITKNESTLSDKNRADNERAVNKTCK